MAVQTKEEKFLINLPGDLFATMEEMESYAIYQAREEADTYVIPCEWYVSSVSGELGDYEIDFVVVRRSNA